MQQQICEKDIQKQEYLRKLHYTKMTLQEQVYCSQLHFIPPISSGEGTNTDCDIVSFYGKKQEVNNECNDDDLDSLTCHNDNHRRPNIDPIIQEHMKIPLKQPSSYETNSLNNETRLEQR